MAAGWLSSLLFERAGYESVDLKRAPVRRKVLVVASQSDAFSCASAVLPSLLPHVSGLATCFEDLSSHISLFIIQRDISSAWLVLSSSQ